MGQVLRTTYPRRSRTLTYLMMASSLEGRNKHRPEILVFPPLSAQLHLQLVLSTLSQAARMLCSLMCVQARPVPSVASVWRVGTAVPTKHGGRLRLLVTWPDPQTAGLPGLDGVLYPFLFLSLSDTHRCRHWSSTKVAKNRWVAATINARTCSHPG